MKIRKARQKIHIDKKRLILLYKYIILCYNIKDNYSEQEVEMKLIIAEKPSLGRNIADAIGGMRKRQGYLENDEYIVTWAFGHLFSLEDIEHYNPNPDGTTRWTMDNLPCFPEKFEFSLKKGSDKKPDEGIVRQFLLMEQLCNRPDVDTIINAGDADREGEIIVRLCVDKALHSEKSFLRLWLPDQTPETVRAALNDMKNEDEYRNLANEGLARTYIDWLYGVNLTRYATIRTGLLLRVGRVIIPIVKAIYDRDKQIENFVPEKYYGIKSNEETKGEEIELVSKLKFAKNELEKAKKTCDDYNSRTAVVKDVKRKKDKISPGKLYSLTKLQNALSKRYKMNMTESLEIVQKLYEMGYLTYPRTNSEYLATAEKDKIEKIVNNFKNLGYKLKFRDDKTVFDDSKIESHSALTPTYKVPKKDELDEKQRLVYSTVVHRFAAVFCEEECIANKTEITIDLDGLEEFTLKGAVIIQKGWTAYDVYSAKDKLLPPLEKGDSVNIKFEPVEKESTPPKHYTVETLNNYLKNPFREEKANADEEMGDDAEEYKAMLEGLELGTEATRTGIIENACKSNYILLKKDTYYIQKDGEFLIESLSQMNISMDKYKTSQLGKALKQVFRGEIAVDDSVKLATEEISKVFQRQQMPVETDDYTGSYGDVVGTCPLCGKEVIRGRYKYGCRGYKEGCTFGVSLNICNRNISVSNVKLLLETGQTAKICGFVSKRTGKVFDGALKLVEGKAVFDFT